MHLDPWTILLQTINFAILVWLLHRFLYKPVLAMIDGRKREVLKQIDDANAAKAEAKNQLAAIEAARAGIVAERDATLRDATARANDAAEARRTQAEQEAAAIVDSTRKTLADDRKQVLEEAQRLALELGAGYARRLIGEMPAQVRAEAWIERIETYLAGLPETQIQALTQELARGETLTVVTATEIPSQTTETWRARLHHRLGDVPIVFTTDPALVAGAELHFPTAILSFSWRSALSAMQSELAHAGNH